MTDRIARWRLTRLTPLTPFTPLILFGAFIWITPAVVICEGIHQ